MGLGLAVVAVVAFTSVLPGSSGWQAVFPRVYHPKDVGILVQLFCEDVAVAVLFVRLQAAIGLRGTVSSSPPCSPPPTPRP